MIVAGRRADLAPALIFAAGCVVLGLRSIAPISIAATAVVGLLGFVAWPRSGSRADARGWVPAVAIGSGAVLATLAMGDAMAPVLSAIGVLGVCVAAIAEEAFFRRALYGWLEARGVWLAIGVSAIAFGLVHVPVYGWRVLPLDVAAGVLFGWQRWASGSWTAPAATHLVANLAVLA